MKPFESVLALQLESFVEYRIHQGFSEKNVRGPLRYLDQYLKDRNAGLESLSPSFFLTLRSALEAHPRTANAFISTSRNFFQYLIRQGVMEQNPLQDIPMVPKNTFVPFVFSPGQIDQMLYAICNRLRKKKQRYLKDLGVYMAILLMARCGMRVSETCRLKNEHYRPDDGTLYIEKTKFSKDRLIPVPQTGMDELANYLAVRKELLDGRCHPYLFIGKNNSGLSKAKIDRFFHAAIRDIGIYQPRQTIGDMTFGAPSVHSLRHSFAINTLKRIRDQGKCTQHALPVLAVYMGHRRYQYTGAYLKVLSADHRQGLIDFAKSQLDYI